MAFPKTFPSVLIPLNLIYINDLTPLSSSCKEEEALSSVMYINRISDKPFCGTKKYNVHQEKDIA
jgi:hypothetical protein